MTLKKEISKGDQRIFDGDSDFRFANSFNLDQDKNAVFCVRIKTPQGNRIQPLADDQVYYDADLDAYVVDLTYD